MFTCYAQDDREKKGISCRFKEVSSCREQVSKYICNGHAELFGITYKLASYLDGNNNAWSNIESYISSSSSFNLPLFIDANGEISMSEIHSFALSVSTTHPNIKIEAFQNAIACLMGINAYDNMCKFGGWLDEEFSTVLVQDNNDVRSINDLPHLHALLFHYSKPSLSLNNSDGSQVYLIPTISLQYDMSTYKFRVPNERSVLKWTTQPNCVATPIVLNAIRQTSSTQQVRAFRPVNNYNVIC